MSTELTQKSNTGVATLDDFKAVGGTGFEDVRASDILIPRLVILQSMSPQVNQNKPEYDKTARVGDIYDIGLQERFPEGIEIVVAHFKTVWVEWSPERSTKPPIAVYEDETILKKAERSEDSWQLVLPNGNPLTETAQFYVINLTTAERRKSFLPMSITQLKKAKRLVTWAQAERVDGEMPPMFWRSYFLTTVPERNNKGDWMGWKVERGTPIIEREDSKALLREIKLFREAVLEGRAHGDLGGENEPSSDKAF